MNDSIWSKEFPTERGLWWYTQKNEDGLFWEPILICTGRSTTFTVIWHTGYEDRPHPIGFTEGDTIHVAPPYRQKYWPRFAKISTSAPLLIELGGTHYVKATGEVCPLSSISTNL